MKFTFSYDIEQINIVLQRKYGYLLLLSIILSLVNCEKETTTNSLRPQITLTTTFGGSQIDVANSVTKTRDKGYVITGHTASSDNDITIKATSDVDVLLAKYNHQDELVFQKTYGGLDDDRANSIIETNDGGFAIQGYTTSNSSEITTNGLRDFWLIKTDENGNQNWQKTFGFSGNDTGLSVIQTSDNGYLLTGILDVSASNGLGNSKTEAIKHAGGDFWVIKLTATGEVLWSKYFGGFFTDTPFDIVETSSGAYIIVGSSDSNDVDITNNLGSYDYWVISIATNGELNWQKNYGGSEIDEARSIVEASDGNYFVVGDTRSNDKQVTSNNGGADIWLIKIDTNGNLLWDKSYGGSNFDVARNMITTSSNQLFICGSSRSSDNNFTNQGQNDGVLLKVDENGNLLWQKTIGGTNIDFLYDITQTTENEYIAVGETSSSDIEISNNNGFSDVLIVKIEE